MLNKLHILPAAIADIDDAARFIAKDNLAAALRFYNYADESFEQIRLHPRRWPRYELDDIRLANLRRRPIHRFTNYLIFYQIDSRFIQVLRVLHGARDIAAILLDELDDQ